MNQFIYLFFLLYNVMLNHRCNVRISQAKCKKISIFIKKFNDKGSISPHDSESITVMLFWFWLLEPLNLHLLDAPSIDFMAEGFR